MRKFIFTFLLLLVFAPIVSAQTLQGHLGGQDSNGNNLFEVYSDGDLISASGTYKYATMPLSELTATRISIAAPGSSATSVGLAGTDEIGSTEGFVSIGEAADFLRFNVQIPETFSDEGTSGDLVIEFDLSETGAAEGNYDVRIFEYGNTTPIVTDTITVANGASRAWSGLDTLSSGIGADADISADDVLLVEFTANADADDVDVFGARLKYRVGLDVTQS